jgi:hypothetical protein
MVNSSSPLLAQGSSSELPGCSGGNAITNLTTLLPATSAWAGGPRPGNGSAVSFIWTNLPQHGSGYSFTVQAVHERGDGVTSGTYVNGRASGPVSTASALVTPRPAHVWMEAGYRGFGEVEVWRSELSAGGGRGSGGTSAVTATHVIAGSPRLQDAHVNCRKSRRTNFGAQQQVAVLAGATALAAYRLVVAVAADSRPPRPRR